MAEATLSAPMSTARVAAARTAARLVTPWSSLILAALALRVLVSLVGAGIMLVLPGTQHASGPGALLLAPWRHFDALWFTDVAAHGYGSSPLTTAYMPLYPLLIRFVAVATGGHYLSAALIVSNLSLPVACGLIWRWVAETFNPRVAWRTVILVLVYPDAFFLVGAYSEATFLALSAGCLLALRRDRPLLAGALALLATLTRLQGLVLMVPMVLALSEGLRLRVWGLPCDRGRGSLRYLIGAALPLLGVALYQRLLTGALHGGNIFSTFHDHWHIALQAPWQTIWQYVSVIRSPRWHLFHSPQYNYILLWDLLIALIVLGVLLASWRRLGWQLALFGLAGWCFLMTRWYSTGRYMLGVLPFFIALALWSDSPRRVRWLCLACVPVLCFFTAQFAQNSWVD